MYNQGVVRAGTPTLTLIVAKTRTRGDLDPLAAANKVVSH